MNLKERDKKLLMILGAVILLTVYYLYFLQPQIGKIGDAKSKILSLQNEYDSNKIYQQRVKGLDSKIRVLVENFKDLREVYPPCINYEETIIIIRDIAKSEGLKIDGINFGDAASASDEKDKQQQSNNLFSIKDPSIVDAISNLGLLANNTASNKSDKSESEKAQKVKDGQGYAVDISFDLVGTNEQIRNFIAKMESLKNTVKFSKVSMSKNKGETGNTLNASVSLSFLGIFEKNLEGKFALLPSDIWKKSNLSAGRNILTPYLGYGSATNEDTSTKPISETVTANIMKGYGKYDNYNFVMNILPYEEKGYEPNVGLSVNNLKRKDLYYKTFIYGAKKDISKFELVVEDKADLTYYCKFKGEEDAFPNNAYNEEAQFVPVNDKIEFLVNSGKRISDTDKSGVVLKLENNSQKEIIVYVKNDDVANPRFKIEKAGKGQIQVFYN